jgi:hypothetical protein
MGRRRLRVARVGGLRSYDYIGPVELTALVSPDAVGRSVRTLEDFTAWIAARSARESEEPFTFVVDVDVVSWDAVAEALDRIGLPRPRAFTHEVVFRRCPGCAELNIVKEGYFVCAFCEGDLPDEWNLDVRRL